MTERLKLSPPSEHTAPGQAPRRPEDLNDPEEPPPSPRHQGNATKRCGKHGRRVDTGQIMTLFPLVVKVVQLCHPQTINCSVVGLNHQIDTSANLTKLITSFKQLTVAWNSLMFKR